jgi:hypothetical protein
VGSAKVGRPAVVNDKPISHKRGISVEKEKKFLAALRTTKMNVTQAAKLAGLKGASGLYRHRAQDLEFAERWAEIEDEILDALEEAQYRDAEVKPEDRRYVLSRRRARRWSEKAALAVAVQSVTSLPMKPIEELTDDELLQIAATGTQLLGQDADTGARPVEATILKVEPDDGVSGP